MLRHYTEAALEAGGAGDQVWTQLGSGIEGQVES